MALGALGVSTSAVLIGLSGAGPGTATFFRCLLALPLLVVLARVERARQRPFTRAQLLTAVAAGVMFAGDAWWWTEAIGEVGAGLSTVLVNAQVVFLPLLALVVDREPISRTFLLALPFMVLGIVLTGGVLESGASGDEPVLGTVHAILAALCYSGFLFLLRRGGASGRPIGSYTVVVATSAGCALAAAPFGATEVTPGWEVVGWLALVAVGGQVMGWLLVAIATPHLPADVGAALLMLTPVGALVLGALVLSEHPSALQLVGCALMLGSAYAVSRAGR
jgi:drug/metabolite transporter (DMT)-like permease